MESLSQVDMSSPDNSDPFGADFDDIEKILANPQQPGQSAARTTANRSAEPIAKKPIAKKPSAKTNPKLVRSPSQTQTKKQQTPPTRQQPRKVVPTPPPHNDDSDDGPMLPNDQWQSDDTRKRKRFVTRLIFFVGSLLLLCAIAAAVFLNLPKPDPAVAKNDDPENTQQAANDDEKKIVNIKNEDERDPNPLAPRVDANGDETEDVPQNQQPFNGGVEARIPRPRNVAGNGNNAMQPVELNVFDEDNGRAARIPDDAQVNNNPIGNNDPINANPINNQNPAGFAAENPNQPNAQPPNAIGNRNNPRPAIPNIGLPGGNQDTPAFPKPDIPGGISPLEVPPLPDMGPIGNRPPVGKPPIGNNQPANLNLDPDPPKRKVDGGSLDKIDNKIGDLSGLLSQNGTSLEELRELATVMSADGPVGMPKYYFKKPAKPLKFNPEKLNLNIDGMLYNKAILPQFCRDINSLTGVPITIDAKAIVNAGKNPNAEVTTTIKAIALNSAIDEVLAPMGLTKVENENGLTITASQPRDFVTEKIPLPNSARINDNAKRLFLSYIQGMIEPEIWVRQENPASIQIEAGNIVSTCPIECQFKIKRMVSKLASAISLIDNKTDKAAAAVLQTRTGSILPKLEKNISFRHTVQTPIGPYLNKLHKETGVSVIVDWKNVVSEGWTPQTKVPGMLSEPNVKELIRQVAISMNLRAEVVDQNTLVLTTIQQANSNYEIEVYSVTKLLAGKFDEASLKEVFGTTLDNALRNSRYVFDSTCQCFIVAAPQSKQRQVELLLNRLEDL